MDRAGAREPELRGALSRGTRLCRALTFSKYSSNALICFSDHKCWLDFECVSLKAALSGGVVFVAVLLG